MDGVLVDTEPLWQEAEVEIFGALGVPLTRAMCAETMGLRIDEVVRYWHERHPWTGQDHDEVRDRVVEKVAELTAQRAAVLPGVEEAIALARERAGRTAVASSSSTALIDAVIDRFGWAADFDVLCSAETEAAGKPHPGVYLSAAAALGLPPDRCLAIEDSPHGVTSARRAGMTCIGVTGVEGDREKIEGAGADIVVPTLEHLEDAWDALNARSNA